MVVHTPRMRDDQRDGTRPVRSTRDRRIRVGRSDLLGVRSPSWRPSPWPSWSAPFGVASDEYSFGYVAGWAGDGDEAISAIKSAGSRIQRTADDILSRMEVDEQPATAAA
jgi:hypothetical protein